MQIPGIEGKTLEQVRQEIKAGGKFVVYQYTISLILITFKRSSSLHYIPPGEKAAKKGLPYTLLSLVFGWWGIPWGPIYTVQTIFSNLDGHNASSDVLRALAQAEPMPTPST